VSGLYQLNAVTDEIVKCYRSVFGETIVDIFLYGSYARVEHDDESDIDIAAIVKGKRADLQKKLKYVWEFSVDLGMENDIVISPMVIPYDEFEQYKRILPYYRNIVKEGKKIG